MIYFPNAKINLGLHIIEKRVDGFHNLETVFYPIGLSDVIEVLPHPTFKFVLSGINVDGDTNNNLCVKAYQLLKNNFNIPSAYIQLHKIIPIGAGLGGGSADAAFVLKALNNEFKQYLTAEQLRQYAAQLGSDCAFFIDNQPAIATKRGEVLSPINVSLKGYHLALVKPNIHIGTAEAYANVTPKQPNTPLAHIIAQPVEYWRECLINDFETTIFKRHPQIADIKQQLYNAGATYAAMSGSGSAVFGLFKNKIDIKPLFKNCFTYTEELK